MTIDNMDQAIAKISQHLRYIRRTERYTQTETGRILGVSFQQLQKYETGANRVSAAALWMLAQNWQVSVQSFFPAEEDYVRDLNTKILRKDTLLWNDIKQLDDFAKDALHVVVKDLIHKKTAARE